jgi:hypothetical protein
MLVFKAIIGEKALDLAWPCESFQMDLCDLLKENPIFSLNFCASVLNQLLILLLVNVDWGTWMIGDYRLNLSHLLPMPCEI